MLERLASGLKQWLLFPINLISANADTAIVLASQVSSYNIFVIFLILEGEE